LREACKQAGRPTPVVAKIETPEAVQNLWEVVAAADAVMVARGDLGVELPPEDVPVWQRRIVRACRRAGKPVIVATQMLESMIQAPTPTRAEASDVANAVYEGVDAVMLSGETAAGRYPIQAVEMMNAIACQAEAHMDEFGHWKGLLEPLSQNDDAFFVAQAARELAHDRNVAAIAVFTKMGRSALLMSKTRPSVPILAFTPEESTFRRLSLLWGVYPHLVPHSETIEAMLAAVEAAMIASSTIEPGQQVVLICGFPIQAARTTNLALLHTVGEAF
jgi:pyruvate kinase